MQKMEVPAQPVKSPTKIAALLTQQVPVVDRQQTVAQVRRHLTKDDQIVTFNYVYVVDAGQRLIGVVSIKELLQASPDMLLSKLMIKEVVTARPTTSPERAAYLALKHNIKAIPVVDKNGVFQGVLSSDDILAVLYHEFRQDLLRLGGIVPSHSSLKSVADTSIQHSLRSKLPWIVVGLLGGALIAQFMTAFEEILITDIMFVPFIPLVVYIANAVGVQSQTLFIRDQSQDPNVNAGRFLSRQMVEGVGIGLFTWLSLTLLTLVLWQSASMGFIVGLAMVFSILVAIFQAVTIPYLLIKFKQDPAIGSGPFATIMQDFTSVAIYIGVIAWLG